MRILLEQVAGNSGVDIWMSSLGEALRRRGHDARVVFHPHHYQYAPSLARVPRADLPLAARAPLPADWRPDIVQGSSWNAFAFRREGIPLVVSEQLVVHDRALRPFKTLPQHLFHKLFVWPFEERSFAEASAVAAASRHTQRQLSSIFHVESDVVYNSVDEQRFNPNAEKFFPPQSRPDRFKLFWAGNPSRRKGFDLLQPVLSELGDKFELWIASGFRSERLGKLDGNVINLGRVEPERMPAVMAACDAFFFPTREEGFGIVVAEAMACCKPCVVSDACSMPELIISNKGGYTCSVNSAPEYVHAIRKLADSPRLREEFGAFNRQRVLELFTLDCMGRGFERIYERVRERKGH